MKRMHPTIKVGDEIVLLTEEERLRGFDEGDLIGRVKGEVTGFLRYSEDSWLLVEVTWPDGDETREPSGNVALVTWDECPDCGGAGEPLGGRDPDYLTKCGNCKGWYEG